jgi:hypothetical protein
VINIDENPLETEEGVWTPPFKGVEFLVSHVSNIEFQNKLARLQQPYAKQIEKRKLAPAKQRDILCKAMAGTLLRGWRGSMVDKDGNAVKYTDELAERVLLNNIEVRDFVTEFSGDLDNYRQEEADEVGKS